jgi:putative flavoprotein involved in K+ transport
MSGEQGTERYDVVIIGAGQAGLAAGYHLARRGIQFLILEDHERIGDNWRTRWESLRLYSPAAVDGLPGMRFPAKRFAYPSGREMGDYLESYARAWKLPVRTGIHVDRLRRRDDGRDGFVIEAGDQRFEADQVIVATGAFQKPHVPEFAGELDPGIRQLHSSAYRSPSQLQYGPVLVVGASHSGADIAVEAAAGGHRTVLAGHIFGQLPVPLESRRGQTIMPIMFLLAKYLLTIRTPIGRKMAPRIRMGGGPLLRVRRPDLDRAGVERSEERVQGVSGGKPVLGDGRAIDVANVVWCTGFRPDFRWIGLPIVDADGWPVQTRGVVDSVPGLYFLGLIFQYSFTSVLVGGASRDAGYVVNRIADRAAAEPSPTRLAARVARS